MNTPDIFRLKSDINGNSRFAVSFFDLEVPVAGTRLTLGERYSRIVKLANRVGGRRYNCGGFAYGIAFQAYEHQMPGLVSRIRAMQQE